MKYRVKYKWLTLVGIFVGSQCLLFGCSKAEEKPSAASGYYDGPVTPRNKKTGEAGGATKDK